MKCVALVSAVGLMCKEHTVLSLRYTPGLEALLLDLIKSHIYFTVNIVYSLVYTCLLLTDVPVPRHLCEEVVLLV